MEIVKIPREQLEAAYNYIMHCGANAIMRGEDHPQKHIVDWLEAALAPMPDAEAIAWAESQFEEVEQALNDPTSFSAARNILRLARRGNE